MTGETVARPERFEAPCGRQVALHEVPHDSVVGLLRVRIREGRRSTVTALDASAAGRLGAALRARAERNEA